MKKNEIIKALYRQKPIANFRFIKDERVYYEASVKNAEEESIQVDFGIPFSDIGKATFLPIMEGQLLIRWFLEDE